MQAPPTRATVLPPESRGPALVAGGAAILCGVGLIIASFDPLHPVDRVAIPNPLLVPAGVFVGAIGSMFVISACELGLRAQAAAAPAMLLALATVATCLVFGYEFIALSALPFGNYLPRIACIAVDLYIAVSF